ncbi:hypothetical protein SAMN05444166_5293 [Singulisphaera sp. GP187]|uniref:hypothetical protein n=1 Tax=Singulisphaera sp. GP187 TaxID=1882752 RepID=UPI0009285623|nr:hypothetical protein [Singulisphaera sp. GP187]SIO56779.1 hypothetical protein SAMN05444166_5293 [Singulisphaera sp. GP187]
MKSLAAFALVLLLLCAPALAQQASRQPQSPGIEFELIEIAQDVDKTILREALMVQGRQGLKAEANLSEKEANALSEFIAKKKADIIARAAELGKSRVTGMRVPNAVSPAPQQPTGRTPSRKSRRHGSKPSSFRLSSTSCKTR